ncbi:asparagine synthase (glutamine-hydrolyzing) [Lipingzhangella sp. LS1_29]|uniref:asparagine synthase (glutamine-hydrolyzing) n=1 Tax=Lipingzhangella rawalii TaxID=2055835 RepID=A0ABU2H2T9_9ACTN|nr:asparagine synthase (glutamine-hydrolyzing) [Lipingzhangella rawalii]MDS1269611.1 asparagine synthase (glutamine-hydrolyzing) [Lipingzhangella rawalii]
MCGIAGQWLGGRTAEGEGFVRAACAAMQHRGPDETAVHTTDRVTLGVTRLRVIGLVGGQQPAWDTGGTVTCVVNGEIYNHHELRALLATRGRVVRGTSDVHVIPDLYAEFGDAFVHYLRGMFAIALYDTRRARLLLVTDRLGKKPLYYAETPGGGTAFASELSALMTCREVSRDIDPVAIDQYLSYRIVPAPHTVFRGARRLPPASLMTLDRDGTKVQTYWCQPFDGSLRATPPADIVERLDTLLARAVAERLESEVPLGAMLSGGLDSALVVSLASGHLGHGLHTFSIGFSSSAFDERSQAERVAAHFGTQHHSRLVDPAEASDVADQILIRMGQPYAFPSAIAAWTMYELASRYVTVVLTGDGSDEMFCGYARYQRLLASAHQDDLAQRYAAVLADGVPGATKDALYHPRFRTRLPDEPGHHLTERFARTLDSASELERAMQVDATFWLSDAQLVKIDRMAMAHSVEPRSPMLDHRLVEYARRVPAELNLHDGVEKRLLKRLASRYLPVDVVQRRKQELAVPLEEWLTASLRPVVIRTLLSEASLERGYFAPDALRRLVTEYRPEHSYALWTLYMLERWHQLNLDQHPENLPGECIASAPLTQAAERGQWS